MKTIHVKQAWMRYLLFLGTLVALNILSDAFYRRIDLTKEKRYTLSPATKKLVEQLDDVVYFNIYLDGNLPSAYKRLQNSAKDMLNEFRHVSNGNIEFHFEDILEGKSIQEKDDILKQLYGKGLQFAKPELEADEAASADKYIIPGGVAFYKGTEYPLNFLKREFGKDLEGEINGSVELLEYEIGNALRRALAGKEIKIGFTQGHGELAPDDLADIAKKLGEFYKVDGLLFNLNDTSFLKRYSGKLGKTEDPETELIQLVLKDMMTYRGIIVAKPRERFSSVEKFLLDQYVMNGGRLLWIVDPLLAEMDSIAKYPSIMTIDYDLDLNDLFFRYGVRLNTNLIQDLQCHGIPVLDRKGGNRPGFLPWLFFPTLTPDGGHPIVKNLTSVWARFVSSIDTIPKKNQQKTVLLHSSPESRIAFNPVNISMNMLAMKPDPRLFIKGNQTCAVLIEGGFQSPFKMRSGFKGKTGIPYKDAISQNKMIFIADGDIIANQKSGRGEIYPLGYDRFASSHFGEPIEFANAKFIQNCVDYLCDSSNLIEVRSKEVVLRLLNKPKVKAEKTYWQAFNLLLPLLALFAFGIINEWLRRRKYTR